MFSDTSLLPDDDQPRRACLWVVEDSPLEAEMARRMLAEQYDLVFFAEGLPALEQLAAGPPPDALLLDATLPDTTGREVCLALRARFDAASLPVLFLTVNTRHEDIVAGLEAGANDYMTKPYHPAELLARVANLVRSARLHARVRQLEAHYRGIVSVLTEGVIVQDAKGSLRTINPAAEAILGVRRDEVTGRTSSDAEWGAVDADGAPLDASEHAPMFALRTGAPQHDRVMGLRRPDGALVWVSINAQPLRHPDTGELAGVVSSFLDVTERRRAEAERAELLDREQVARALAELANRLKDEFIATTSHELRSPLTAILGWTRMLRAGNLKPEARDRALATVERNALAQVQLIEDLLDTLRVTSGKLRLEIRPLDVAVVVHDAVESIRPAADSKDITLDVHAGEGARATGDPDRLQQVVWNLLANAVKFTPKGGRVEVRLGRVGTNIELAVRDSGKGMAADFVPYAFDRFRQAEGSTTRRHGGLGLGLALVRSLVELHGGTVRAESPGEGLGSTFTVTLPVRAAYAASDAEALSTTAPNSAPGEPDAPLPNGCLEGLRVLIVDDEADARDLVTAALRAQGAQVAETASVEEALASLRREVPDVLLSDIGMASADGFELIQRVRALPAEQGGAVRAAALTAYDRSAIRSRTLAAGFEMHLSKPIEPATLVAAVARLGRSSR